MKWVLALGALAIVYLFAFYNPTEPKLLFSNHYFLSQIDNPSFSNPTDTSQDTWKKYKFGTIPLYEKPYWIQATFNLEDVSSLPKALFISLLGAYEVYWDGEQIGKNGIVGQNELNETAGKIDSIFLIPSSNAVSGTHTLSMRISSNHRPISITESGLWAFIGDYNELTLLPVKKSFSPLVMSGAMLLAALISVMLFLKGLTKSKSLIFGLLCISVFLLCITEAWRGYWGYSYDIHIIRLELIKTLTLLVGGLIVLSISSFYTSSIRFISIAAVIYILAMIGVVALISGYDNLSQKIIMVSMLISIAVSLLAIYKRQLKSYSLPLCILLVAIPLFINPKTYMDMTFFVSFSILVGTMLYTYAEDLKRFKDEATNQKLNNERLKLELVKKHIQPHFLMNTLTALEELIEQSPDEAVNFIEKLSELFRQVYTMVDKPVIALADELTLCHAYIELLNCRTGSNVKLIIQGEIGRIILPPGIMLTLIENAFSHNNYQGNTCEFLLDLNDNESASYLRLTLPVVKRLRRENIGSGLGGRYIEARMSEAYESNWSIETCSGQLQPDTFLKEFSYSTGD